MSAPLKGQNSLAFFRGLHWPPEQHCVFWQLLSLEQAGVNVGFGVGFFLHFPQ